MHIERGRFKEHRLSQAPLRQKQTGFSLIEVLIGVLILSILMTGMIQYLLGHYRANRLLKDSAFAYAKAQSIVSEILAYAEKRRAEGIEDISDVDDSGLQSPTLTIAKDASGNPVAPDHPLSQNYRVGGKWVWSRLIRLSGVSKSSNKDLRLLNVKIFKRDQRGHQRMVADVSTVVNALASVYPTTQVFDLFLIDIESVPGWWVAKESIRAFAEAMVDEMEVQNPGLDFRVHWITKAAYGRNPVYRPYLNSELDSWQSAPDVYTYPGRMPPAQATSFYYPPDAFRARISVDGKEVNGYDADLNPYPYAVADYYNHAMRYPREKALHDRRVAAVAKRKHEIAVARAKSTTPPPRLTDMSEAPTLRLFLEDLNSNPDKYRNAIIINLHGELLPVPPLRNYSDPAKAPDVLPNVRVVTHPEELRTLRDPGGAKTDRVKLRVYAYVTNPDTYTGSATMPEKHPIVVQVMDLDLTDGAGKLGPSVALNCLAGGASPADLYQPMAPATEKSSAPPGTMSYEVEFVDPGFGQRKYTLFRLYNTPVVCPQISGAGLAATDRARLYGLEYVPSCTGAALDFSNDLSVAGDGPKNTARWVISIPKKVFTDKKFVQLDGTQYDPASDVMLTMRTRILDPALADPLATGTMFPTPIEPENFSETYTWWAASRDAVPWTERFQFQGDPRHNPYKDLLTGDPDFPDGYNCYHDAIAGAGAAADYPGIDPARLASGWMATLGQDVPRAFALFRRGLVESKCIFSTMTGWSFYYVGVGNEIGGDDANGYPNSIPVDQGPWGSPGTQGYANNITGQRCFIRSGASVPLWWGMPWLGELYPDSAYAKDWFGKAPDGAIRGNLAAGAGASAFFRQPIATVYADPASPYRAYGTTLVDVNQRTQSLGCTSFFNVGTSGSTFHHKATNVAGDLTPDGNQIAARYSLQLPPQVTIKRPFSTAASGGVGPEWTLAPYATDRYSAKIYKVYYYDAAPWAGSGIVEVTNGSGLSSGWFFMNGVAESTVLGPNLLAKLVSLGALHSFFEIATSAHPSRPLLMPRVEIKSPTITSDIDSPTQVEIRYGTEWKRWDGQPYTEETNDLFSDDEAGLRYAIMYSRDGGVTWRYVQDDSLAKPGELPADVAYQIPDWNANADELYMWDTPAATIPSGTYIIRVEVHRTNQALHYSVHQVQVFIQR